MLLNRCRYMLHQQSSQPLTTPIRMRTYGADLHVPARGHALSRHGHKSPFLANTEEVAQLIRARIERTRSSDLDQLQHIRNVVGSKADNSGVGRLPKFFFCNHLVAVGVERHSVARRYLWFHRSKEDKALTGRQHGCDLGDALCTIFTRSAKGRKFSPVSRAAFKTFDTLLRRFRQRRPDYVGEILIGFDICCSDYVSFRWLHGVLLRFDGFFDSVRIFDTACIRSKAAARSRVER